MKENFQTQGKKSLDFARQMTYLLPRETGKQEKSMAYWNCDEPSPRKVRFRIAGKTECKEFTVTGYVVVDAPCDDDAIAHVEDEYGPRDLIENAENLDCDIDGEQVLGPSELVRDAIGPVTVDLDCSEDA